MYIKMVDKTKLFGAIHVGEVFIYNECPYLKIQSTSEQYKLDNGGIVIKEHNALNLAIYEVEWIDDHAEVEYHDSTLVIGAGKGEV